VHASPVAQIVVHEPQCWRSLSVSTHEPLHSTSPDGQPLELQSPPAQTSPAAQAWPHDPQFPWSEASSTQTPLHAS
jgi:hypothetical protein